MAVGHYENFPVASWLVPARLRPAIVQIYRFARTADDIADEGDATADARLQQLASLGAALDDIERGRPSSWPQLAEVIRVHRLPLQPFRDLLSAFAQDVCVKRYATFDALLDYCRRSANPIGRLLLSLYQRNEHELHGLSDAICTGLQLTNFWQDVAIDWRIGRVYLPQDDLQRFGVREADLAAQRLDRAWCELMRFEVERAREFLVRGQPLSTALNGRIGLELGAVVHGGLRVLERIDRVNGDVFHRRPRLNAHDWVTVGWRSLIAARSLAAPASAP